MVPGVGLSKSTVLAIQWGLTHCCNNGCNLLTKSNVFKDSILLSRPHLSF